MLDSSFSFARCRSQSCGSNRVYETRRLVNEEQSLWTKGSAYPPAESDVLRIPFQFRLPENLPPSFHYDGIGKRASVLYSVKATGARPGLLKFDKQIAKPIAIVPKDDIAAALRVEDKTGWKVVPKTQFMTKGLWGDYAEARVEVHLRTLRSVLF